MSSSASHPPRLHALGDAALVCTLAAPATLAQQRRIWALREEALRWPAVSDALPGMNNLTLLFDPALIDAAELEIQVLAAWPQLVASGREDLEAPGRTVEIPVAYGGAHGPDLADVAAHTGLAPAEVVRRHAGGEYVVYLLGFLPGFAFLGGLAPE
ncbi:MAG TPA: carboxyltransferase domain-containing protein, partial [Variovorax sp.]|nr:carboxyltransferase domain-containing protein [Variovorax sp.]